MKNNERTIYYRVDSNSGFEDSHPMTPSKWEFTCEVVRMFTASESYVEWYNSYYSETMKSCTFEELVEICPIPREELEKILFIKGQKLFNIFEEIKRNKETGIEWWESDKSYNDFRILSKEPAKDKEWYKPYTYKERMKILKNWK